MVTMTIEEFMNLPDRSFGQFYGFYKRGDGKTVTEMADEFLSNLGSDIAEELRGRGFDIEFESIVNECESIRGSIERLISICEYDNANFDKRLKEVFTEGRGAELCIRSRNGLLNTRACCIFDENPNELSIEFND